MPAFRTSDAPYRISDAIMSEDHSTHNAHVDASATALDNLTTAAENHDASPEDHIHKPASADHAHSWIRRWIPQAVQEEYEVYYHMGNYVIDRRTGQKTFEDMSIYVRLGMHFLYYGYYQQRFLSFRRVEQLLKDQSAKMGAMYDAPESKTHIVPFIESFQLWDSMKDMVKEKPEEYATFNEFFSREVKPEARPVDEPENELVTSSAADCQLTVFPTIDLAKEYWIKGTPFTLEHLLQDKELAEYFDGGSIVIHRLAPQDYHRWHSPVTGTVDSIRKIEGSYYTVNPQAITQSGTLNVFCENRRDVAVINREATGSKIAVVAVGAMLVGSICWMPGLEKPGAVTRRGECQGYFQYGGSTVISLYPKGEVKLDEDLVQNSTKQNCETVVRVGWRVGTSYLDVANGNA